MKRRITVLLYLIIPVFAVTAQEKFMITGSVKSLPQHKVTANLYYSSPSGQFTKDTCTVRNGSFHFQGEVARPLTAFLALTDGPENLYDALARGASKPNDPTNIIQIGMFLEKGKITALIDYQNQQDAVINGTANNDAYQAYRPVVERYKKLESSLISRNKSAAQNAAEGERIVKEYAVMKNERTKDISTLIEKYPSSLASLDLLKRWIDPADNISAARKCFNLLSAELQGSKSGQAYLHKINQISTVDVGAVAPEFNLKNASGKLNKLTDYKGKYVLIDFWASWCVPCRKETPNLISVYNDYKDKNFEILGVSLDGGKDDSRDKWLEAISQDKMSWPQLSDLVGFQSPVAKSYAVSAIPMNFLIDPTGKIIAKNLHGQDLRDALKKLL